MAKNKLTPYHKKRDFSQTNEPYGDYEGSAPSEGQFVIQKHASRSLHYDLRLEVDGVLKSWAVPKGPSTDPGHKQLAIQTEDHPLEYASFEGIIKEGNYGAGAVIVWDRGLFSSLKKEKMSTSIRKGEVTVLLEGEKLKGAYALIRTHYQGKKSWLFIKMNDTYADTSLDITHKKPTSVISGKTIEQIARKATKQSS